eukprot:11835072-Karenia_brevis.AAC.1
MSAHLGIILSQMRSSPLVWMRLQSAEECHSKILQGLDVDCYAPPASDGLPATLWISLSDCGANF